VESSLDALLARNVWRLNGACALPRATEGA